MRPNRHAPDWLRLAALGSPAGDAHVGRGVVSRQRRGRGQNGPGQTCAAVAQLGHAAGPGSSSPRRARGAGLGVAVQVGCGGGA